MDALLKLGCGVCCFAPGGERWRAWLVAGFFGKVSVSVLWAALYTMVVVALVSVGLISGNGASECPLDA